MTNLGVEVLEETKTISQKYQTHNHAALHPVFKIFSSTIHVDRE